MHSFDAPSGATYFHNGDFSGDVKFDAQVTEVNDGDPDVVAVKVPFEDLKALVAKYVRDERIEAVENLTGGDTEAVSRLEQMTDDQMLGLPSNVKVTRIIKLQPAPFVDAISDDGHVGTRLPYPFYVNETGDVQNQEFWRGDPLKAVGFQEDLARHEIDLWWDDAFKDPQKAVGMYLVTTNARGTMGVHQTAITSVEVLGK